ncbi:hypothetical protein B9Q13_03780 [Candidatus Marsarchaeota G2 archaeon ECH_B_SAG-G16]|uniref:MoaB/Mog domain-containing protein n=1 Tax=Candidatus Marsarchaeota G2 archaeon ECH_B_SAG-G16 TaxID=1978167 RepID=A0A2R6C1D9_9ARCH|nr:MAG: hypothetical protein B9Q13_03780 [Candidatus Marsarchaeota G2 archaeon ECH_B_SAG-G16]
MDRLGGMHPVTQLTDYEEVLKLVAQRVQRVERVEKVGLSEACGRVSALDVFAKAHIPPFTRATFDGYALRWEDTIGASKAKPVSLKLVGTSKPAKPFRGFVHNKEAVRIFTGAPLPRGADSVVIVENTELQASTLKVYQEVKKGSNLDLEGSDIQKGETLLKKGEVIKPHHLSLLASQGYASVKVIGVRALVIPTGNEVKPVGTKLKMGEIYDSNSFSVTSLLEQMGVHVKRVRPLPDDPQRTQEVLERASQKFELVIFMGGSSAGAEDFVPKAVRSLGEIFVHGVAISPGRPTLIGRVGKAVVVGLPGHSVSSFATTIMIIKPIVRAMYQGALFEECVVEAKLGHSLELEERLTYFRTVKLENGFAQVVYKSSSTLRSVLGAHGYILEKGPKSLKQGERVKVHMF